MESDCSNADDGNNIPMGKKINVNRDGVLELAKNYELFIIITRLLLKTWLQETWILACFNSPKLRSVSLATLLIYIRARVLILVLLAKLKEIIFVSIPNFY